MLRRTEITPSLMQTMALPRACATNQSELAALMSAVPFTAQQAQQLDTACMEASAKLAALHLSPGAAPIVVSFTTVIDK